MYDSYVRTGIFSYLTNFPSGTLENLKGKLVATAFRDKINGYWSYKVYSYDNMGRVKDEYVYFQTTSAYKKISNVYDNLGNLIQQNIDGQFFYWYTYDEQGRLKNVKSSLNSTIGTATLEASYTYDKSDKVLKTEMGNYGAYAPKVLYTYDNQGRVSDINGIAYDVFVTAFHQTLSYYKNDNLYTMNLQNDGNGSWPALNFTYYYDDINRLTSSNCSNSYYAETYEYFDDGNLFKKSRPNNAPMSQTYTYTTGKNRLSSLTKGSSNFTFTYDYNGNMITDSRKPIDSSYPIIYDRRNLPLSIKIGSSTNTYSYDDAGQRIYKQLSSTNMEFYLIDHTGKELAVYNWYTRKQKMFNLYGNGMIGKVNITYDANNNRTSSRQYYIKDHLGSTRLVFSGSSGQVIEKKHYYPFGATVQLQVAGTENDYKYNGKEFENDYNLNWYHYGARYYDPTIGRWHTMDPADEFFSPYLYVGNNPISFIDPDGRQVQWVEMPWVWGDVVVSAYDDPYSSFSAKNSQPLSNYLLPTEKPKLTVPDKSQTPKLDDVNSSESNDKFNFLTKTRAISTDIALIVQPFDLLTTAEKNKAIEFARKNLDKIDKIKNKYKGTIRGFKLVAGASTGVSVLIDLQKNDGTQALIDLGIYAVGFSSGGLSFALAILDTALENEEGGGIKRIFNALTDPDFIRVLSRVRD